MNIVTLTDIIASNWTSREPDPSTRLANQEINLLALSAIAKLPDSHPSLIARLRGCSRQQVYLDRQKALAKVRREV